MRSSSIILSLLFFCSLTLLPACSQDENVPEIHEEYLTAIIDGEKFSVNGKNGTFSCEKVFTNYGTVNLTVKISSTAGQEMEFMIYNYYGKRNYPVRDRTYIAANHFNNGSWLNYSEAFPANLWSSMDDSYLTGEVPNLLRVTEDDGNYVAGNFSFEGHELTGLTSRQISNGSFYLKVMRR